MNMAALSMGLAGVKQAPQFARPADVIAYAVGDLVANSTVAVSVVPLVFQVGRETKRGAVITKARLRKSGAVITNAAFYLHLYRRSPTVTNGDNGVYLSNEADDYIGAFSIPSMMAFSDGAAGNGGPLEGSSVIHLPIVAENIFGLLEARGAYTPASGETFTAFLEMLQD